MLSSSKLLDELLYTATGGKGRGKLRVGDIVCPLCAVIMYIFHSCCHPPSSHLAIGEEERAEVSVQI